MITWKYSIVHANNSLFHHNCVILVFQVKQVAHKYKPLISSITFTGKLIFKFFLALVTFDYQPEAQDELGLKVGDIITGVEQVEEGWCRGSLNGKIGMFPDNFVKVRKYSYKTVKKIAIRLIDSQHKSSRTYIFYLQRK